MITIKPYYVEYLPGKFKKVTPTSYNIKGIKRGGKLKINVKNIKSC